MKKQFLYSASVAKAIYYGVVIIMLAGISSCTNFLNVDNYFDDEFKMIPPYQAVY